MAKTEFVYVCSASFWRYLFLSMRSLFNSGTEVERVVVYVTGGGAERWPLSDPRIEIRPVPDIGGGYWGTNKVHLCDSDADRVVFLDTDVFVARPIQQLWQGRDEDLIARYGVGMYTKFWHPDQWQAALEKIGAGSYPQYSPGFMIFQNGSHRRLKDTWIRLINQILAGKLPPLKANRFAELYAFSLAASLEELSHSAMPEYGHRYAMLGESPDDAIVYHLGTPAFYRHYLPLEAKYGLATRRDLPVPRPPFVGYHSIYTRVKHRLKTRIRGARDLRMEY